MNERKPKALDEDLATVAVKDDEEEAADEDVPCSDSSDSDQDEKGDYDKCNHYSLFELLLRLIISRASFFSTQQLKTFDLNWLKKCKFWPKKIRFFYVLIFFQFLGKKQLANTQIYQKFVPIVKKKLQNCLNKVRETPVGQKKLT